MTDPTSSTTAGSESERRPSPIVAQAVEKAADELRLQPPDCPSRDEFLAQIAPLTLPEPAVPSPPPRFQFTLIDLMVVTVGVAVGLAGGTWMPADYFAGIMGLFMLGGLVLVHFFPLQSRGARLVWGTFILAYFVAVIAAVLRPRPS